MESWKERWKAKWRAGRRKEEMEGGRDNSYTGAWKEDKKKRFINESRK